MKLLLVFLFLMPSFLFAQKNTDWGAISYMTDVSQYAGKKFRLEAAVKVEAIDPTAQAEVWVRVDKSNGKMGFFYNMTDKPIRDSQWKTYTINGTIDKGAARLVFGGIYHRQGIFCFDNFKLWIEAPDKEYQEVQLANSDFETDSLTNWYYIKDGSPFKVSLTTANAYHEKQALKVDGSAFKLSRTYGNNDSTGQYANVNGIKLYYETYGAGEPLLLLHGNSESIASFKEQIPELSKQYKVIAIDTRGQGKSSDDGKPYTYDLFAADMNALLDQLHIDSVNVIGWSDGGNTGILMAMQYPAKVNRLVTMGANVFIDNTVVDKQIIKLLNNRLKELKSDTTTRARNRERLTTLLLTEPRHMFDELKAIRCPVLVMAGEKDIIKPEHTKQIAAHIPNGTLLIVPKATHEYPREDAAGFNKKVLEFLGKQ